jgi:hypothetical protein
MLPDNKLVTHAYVCTQTMYVAEWSPEKGWDKGALKPYGPLQMMPSAQARQLQQH